MQLINKAFFFYGLKLIWSSTGIAEIKWSALIDL